ncbi:KAP family P-loop NTPase fold protein [Phytoactinopolyspora endophytica]|uniref:KAP family P-loop NTPase fold protein n=1 Tax=Phytoactinopolyspora endophytica TaxID=1642495 RepID=UPI0013EAFF06|nr:P-loop NTPase fold protein [Phytoactinopolyspora endophytica]
MPHATLFADDPIDGSPEAPDRLGRDDYAGHVARLLDRVRGQSESSVMALIGAWGSGKSSVLDMVARKLQQSDQATPQGEHDSHWLVATFNPWTYGDVESLHNGFFQELRGVLPRDAKWSDARRRLGEFGKSIAPFMGLVPGVSAENAVKAAGDAIAGDQNANALKAAAEDTLRQLGRPILLIMDDLDRLTPQELLLVFKLVRLVGRLPHVYYLLSYDESTLLDILSRTNLVPHSASTDKRRARDYLEKIIQVRLDLPILRESQALGMVDACLNHVLDENAIALDDQNFDRFRTAFHNHIRRRLMTPRAINRYFAQVEALYVLLGEEADFVDFLLLSWVRTAEPELYSTLQTHRNALTRSDFDVFPTTSQKETHQAALEKWTDRLRRSGVADENIDGVLAVLAQLFLPIRTARDNTEYAGEWLEDVRLRRGVGHVDYFDRYFSFGVPSEDIADSIVREALESLANGKQSDATHELRSKLLSDAARVCRKLGSEQEQGRAPAAALLVFLADLYADLPAGGEAFLDPRRFVQLLASDLLPDVAASEGPRLLRRMTAAPEGVALVATIVSKAQHGSSTDKGKKAIQWLDAAARETRAIIREYFDASKDGLSSLSDEMWRVIWAWRWLDHDEMREWLRAATASKAGWSVEDVLARLSRVDDTGPPPLDMSAVEPLIGVDFAIEHLLPLDQDERLQPAYDLESTWENRVRVARTLLDEERARRSAKASPDDRTDPQQN